MPQPGHAEPAETLLTGFTARNQRRTSQRTPADGDTLFVCIKTPEYCKEGHRDEGGGRGEGTSHQSVRHTGAYKLFHFQTLPTLVAALEVVTVYFLPP